jgi:hypothetical protein
MNTLMRTIAGVLAATMALELVPAGLAAQDDKTTVTNVRFEVVGELVNVYYDLGGPADRVHKIRLILLRETDSLFLYHPVNVTGEVGAVIFPGQRRRIVWDFTKEFPDGMTGNDFYFVVEAEIVKPEGIDPLYYYVGGGALVVGGVLALVLSGKKSTDGGGGTGFPAPPGRPGE